MEYNWTWYALAGVIAGLFVLALAVIVYRAGHRRSNRLLALFLFLWGSQTALNTATDVFVRGTPEEFAGGVLFWATMAAALLAYIPFVSTLDSPLVRPFSRWGLVIYWFVGCVALTILVIKSDWLRIDGPGRQFLSGAAALSFLFGLAVAATAYRRARNPTVGRQSHSYFVAALGHDLLLIPMAIWYAVGAPGVSPRVLNIIVLIVPSVAALWLAVFLFYGIVRFQLFDLDLKLKWTISRGTLAGMFVAVFFAVSEITASLLSSRIGIIAGVSATAVLVFAISPLQRIAERVSNAAMPEVQNNDEYRTVRKREVYQAAFCSAIADGIVTEREKDVLATLAQSLGLGPADVRAIEKGSA